MARAGENPAVAGLLTEVEEEEAASLLTAAGAAAEAAEEAAAVPLTARAKATAVVAAATPTGSIPAPGVTINGWFFIHPWAHSGLGIIER